MPASPGNSGPSALLERHAYPFSWEQAVRIVRKRGRLAILVALIPFVVAIVMIVRLKDVYQPAATIEIAPPMSGMVTVPEIESPLTAEDQEYFDTQTEILKNDALAIRVIRKMHLDANPKFMGGKTKGAVTHIPAGTTPDAAGSSDAVLRDETELSSLAPSEAVALGKFRSALSVNPVRNTRLVDVSFASHDPELSRKVANEVIAEFIQNDYRQRYNSTEQASGWLSSQLAGLHQKVLDSNREVAEYQKKYGVVEMGDNSSMPMSDLMGEVTHQLSEAEAARIENEAYLQMIDSGNEDYVPPLRDDKVYQDQLIKQGDLHTQLAQLRVVYGDENTNVKKIEDELTESSKQIAEEEKRVARGIRTAYAAAKQRENLMIQHREKVREQMVGASTELGGYRFLKSEAMANEELYNTLQARLREAGIYAGLGASNIRVVSLAENLGQPSGPHRGIYLAIAGLLSLCAGIGSCFVKESFDNTVRTPEDVKTWAGLKSLALLPATGLGPGKQHPELRSPLQYFKPHRGAGSAERPIELMRPMTAGAEAMRDLRTALMVSAKGGNSGTILISSPMEKEGKTTVAINLAVVLSQIGRTCLVDADLRQPMVARALGVESKSGLSEVLTGKAALDASLMNPSAFPNLWILPSGAVVENPADVLAFTRMQEICEMLQKQFQFVVLDTPPIIGFSDARHLSRLAGKVVLVGRYGVTTRRAIQRSAELLEDVGAPVAGAVLNGIDYSSPDYHYFTYGYSPAARKSAVPPSTKAQSPDGDSPKSRGAHA